MFCFTDMSSCEWLDFTQNPSKQIWKIQQTYFFLAYLDPYWKAMKFFLNLLHFSDWLLYQQSLIMLLCWLKICAFQLLLSWYKLPQFLGDKLEIFHNTSVMKFLRVRHFFNEYIQEFLSYKSLCFENVLIFMSFTEVFCLKLHLSESCKRYSFRNLKLMDLWMSVPNFLVRDRLWRILLRFKVGPITDFSD